MPKIRKPRNGKLKVFICTAKVDLTRTQEIHTKLKEHHWIEPWLFSEDILGGQDWKLEINKAMWDAHAIIICLSKSSVDRDGHYQVEISDALEMARKASEGGNFIIPLKLNDCEVPTRLKSPYCLDYFKKTVKKDHDKLLQSLKLRAGAKRIKINDAQSNVSINKQEATATASFSQNNISSDTYSSTTVCLGVLTLDEDISRFDSYGQNGVTYMLAGLLTVDEQYIVIKSISEGSVRIVLELPEKAYDRLTFLVESRDKDLFRLFKVTSFSRFETHNTYESVSDLFKPELVMPQTSQTLFVGRENEIIAFRQLLKKPYGEKRIAFVLGDGGTGKTLLVNELLRRTRDSNILAPKELIDLFSTDYRHIDGIQWGIKEIIENLPELVGKPSPFATWVKGKTDTSENFYDCLKKFCAKHPLALAFDTFENLDTVASNWIFKSERGGLQVPGLICIIAGRREGREKQELDGYRGNPLVKEMPISGFSLEEAQILYQKIVGEPSNPLGGDLLKALGMATSDPVYTGVERVWKITGGHPLKLEIAFRWPGDILSTNSLAELSPEQYEEKLMQQVFEWGQQDEFAVSSLSAAQPVFDTLLCMAYVTRRFDMQFLEFLIKENFIRIGDSKVSKEEVLQYLRRYFFVKTREIGKGGLEIIQLHDEMAQLVRKYIWPDLDKSGERRFDLYSAVIRFYDELIEKTSGNPDLSDTLRVEQLHYFLQQDRAKSRERAWKEAGLQRWFELAESGSTNIKELLPGEIKDYVSEYDIETQVNICSRLAGIEENANHINQALGHWEEVRKLGESEQRDDWMVEAFLGKFKADSIKNPEKAYRTYLLPAKRLAETKVPEKLTTVYHDIGFAYRLMQDINEAVKWYEKASEEYRKRPTSLARKAAILNDRGYAYIYLGKWGFTTRDVGDALKIRQSILDESRERLKNAKGEERERLQRAVAGSALRTGMSHNTLGDFGRYADQLENALQHYKEALDLFREADANHWQAKALCGLGETYRRLALGAKKQGDMELCEEQLKIALENMQTSLYICQKYQIDNERDTACRRIGRLYHDRALTGITQQQDQQVIRENLQIAHDFFEEGLKYALSTKDDLEEFENLTEMAFLLDDAIEALGAGNVPAEFRDALENLEKALKKHKNDKIRIYQYPVFENLMRLERAAIAFAYQDYSKALTEYLEAYKGLGSTAGYGIARYRQHRDHLKTQIGKLPRNDLKVEWCEKFIETWKNTAVPGSKPRRTLADDLPDLVEWCYQVLKKSE